MTQALTINDVWIKPGRITLGTYGSVGVDRLAFVFSGEWEGLLTKATFYPVYGSPVGVLASGEVIVPPEMYKKSGVGKLVISGYAIENNVLKKRKYTLPCEMEIPNTIVRKGENSIPETPSVYEQLRAQMQGDIADALQAAKDSGAFDGADGEAATVAVSKTVTLPSGSDASVSNEGTSTNARLVFGIPQGAAGAPGVRGASGVYVLSDGETESDIPSDADIALFPTSQTITLLDGKDGTNGRGIVSIARTTGNGTSGSIDTYTITYTDATTSTFTVQNGKNGSGFSPKGIVASASALPSNPTAGDAYFVGSAAPYDVYVYDATAGWTNIGAINGIKGDAGRGIRNISLTTDGGKGANSVYTITYTDDSTSTFNVYNGADGSQGAKGDPGKGIVSITRTSGNGAAGTTDTYTITYTDSTTTTFTVYNGKNGSDAGITVDSTVTSSGTNAVSGKAVYDYVAGVLGDFNTVAAQMDTLIGGNT